MNAATGGTSNSAQVLARLDALSCDTAEIKSQLVTLARSYQDFRELYLVRHAELEAQTKANTVKLQSHDELFASMQTEIKTLRENLARLTVTNRIISFVGSALGLAVIGLLFRIFTGETGLVTP